MTILRSFEIASEVKKKDTHLTQNCTNFDIILAIAEKVVYIKKYFVSTLKFSDVHRCGISGITLRLKT